jgi:hypothetical protein
MRTTSAIPSLIFIVIFGVGLSLAYFRFNGFRVSREHGYCSRFIRLGCPRLLGD